MLLLLVSSALASTAIVGVRDDVAPLYDAVDDLGGSVSWCFDSARVCAVQFPGDPPITTLSALPSVRYVEIDALMTGPVMAPDVGPQNGPPSDEAGTEDCPDLWDLAAIRAPQAWAIVDGSGAPVVAIQDSGYLLSHLELVGRVSGKYDYGNSDNDPEIEWGSGVPAHGTFISSMIAAVPDNNLGRAGVAPYVKLNLQKIADDDGALYFSYAIRALADVAEGDLGVRVVNYSIGGSSSSNGFRDAVRALADADILMVTAAGNCRQANCTNADNDATPFYPGSFGFDHVVTVAGSTRDDGFNTFSHYGRNSVDLAAPGVDLCGAGALGDDNFYTSGGTSYATPLVAGTAALILEAHPDLSTTELARVLRASAVPSPAWSTRVRSGGRLDVLNAVTTAVPRMQQPMQAVVSGEGVVDLAFSNAGAKGVATVVLEHAHGLSVISAQGWTVASYQAGDSVDLPDAGEVVVQGDTVVVLTAAVDAHDEFNVELVVRGLREGDQPVSGRLMIASDGADYLNAPYRAGEKDQTGFLALSFDVQVAQVYEPPDTDDPFDTGDPMETDSGEGPGVGCGCDSGPGGSAFGWLGVLLVFGVRRRCRLAE